MSALNRKIDPVTRDFVLASGGKFDRSDVIENKIALSFLEEFGAWEGDAELGHRFAELARATDTAENRLRMKDLGRQALKWLLDSGELERVEVTVETYGGGRVAFQVDAYQAGGRLVRVGPLLVSVGAG
jgi:phage gp46-like protein